jgi:DNA-binding transcriptional ArsR family regulator
MTDPTGAAAAAPEAAPVADPRGSAGPEGGAELRQLTGAQEIRALTHPVRLALLEVLSLDGPLTATEAGERIGETATTCSFHLRQLAKYGFVEEAGGGSGRRRPWKLVSRGMTFSGLGDVERSIAANELSHLLMDRWLHRSEQWRRVQHLEPDWAEVTGAAQYVAYLTAEETDAIRRELSAIFDRFREREQDPSKRPDGARAIEAVAFVHPIVDVRTSGD